VRSLTPENEKQAEQGVHLWLEVSPERKKSDKEHMVRVTCVLGTCRAHFDQCK